MKNIIKVALEAKFKSNIEGILEVIEASKNPRVAAEVILGVYESPSISKEKKIYRDKELTFISYDKWENKVCCTFSEECEERRYFPLGTTKEQALNGEVEAIEWKLHEEQTSHFVPTGEVRTREIFIPLEEWNELKIKVSMILRNWEVV